MKQDWRQSGASLAVVAVPGLDRIEQPHDGLRAGLLAAVETMAFYLHYQPQVCMRTRCIQGFEALLRWDHPTRGTIPPNVFIPMAEEMGLISDIGEWVLIQACTEAATWPDHLSVAVNVSALQLRDRRLPAIVDAALRRSGLLPSRLELEITETCMMENTAAAVQVLRRLRETGVRIAIDDFGTGYSSLSCLAELPLDKIKIDRGFVSKLGESDVHMAVIQAIITLCATLGIVCNAEGIETDLQFNALDMSNCAEVQGYLLGRPALPGAIKALLEASNRSGAANRRANIRPEPWGASSNSVFRDIVENANDVIVVTDANLEEPGPTITYVNEAFTRLTGYEAREVIGRSPRILQGPGTDRETLDEIVAALKAGGDAHRKVLNYSKSGVPYWLDMRIVPLRNGEGRTVAFAAIERDVTLDKRRMEELECLADRDALTGVMNRRALLRKVDRELRNARAARALGPCLAYIDVDRFKQVNDEFGHQTGDALLFGIADRLAENVRRIDLIGRVGGEEFAICMPAMPLPGAMAIAERLRDAIAARPFDTPAGPLYVTISVGVSGPHDDKGDLTDLINRADRAMYHAKTSGRDRVVSDRPAALDIGSRCFGFGTIPDAGGIAGAAFSLSCPAARPASVSQVNAEDPLCHMASQ